MHNRHALHTNGKWIAQVCACWTAECKLDFSTSCEHRNKVCIPKYGGELANEFTLRRQPSVKCSSALPVFLLVVFLWLLICFRHIRCFSRGNASRAHGANMCRGVAIHCAESRFIAAHFAPAFWSINRCYVWLESLQITNFRCVLS